MLDALERDCIHELNLALQTKSEGSFLVSGGRTPALLYQRLSHAEIDWQRMAVALVDERWVENSHEKSNEAFIQQTLLQNVARAAKFIVMKTPHATAAEGVQACEDSYNSLSSPFDLTLLGMGADGHTASLFPNAGGLDSALDIKNDKLCAAIEAIPSTVTGAITERMTLTLHALLQSKKIFLLINGEEKLAVYKQAKDEVDVNKMPIAAVLQQEQVPVDVYWAP